MLNGVRSEPALVSLPGPEVGRPRGHRVGGAEAYGGVHGRGFAGAVPARGTVPLRRGSARTACVNGASPRGHGADRGAAWSAAAPTFANFTNIRRGASWGESVESETRKGRPEPDKAYAQKRGGAALRTQNRARGAPGFSGATRGPPRRAQPRDGGPIRRRDSPRDAQDRAPFHRAARRAPTPARPSTRTNIHTSRKLLSRRTLRGDGNVGA